MSSQWIIKGFMSCCICTQLMACTSVAAESSVPLRVLSEGQEQILHPGEQVALGDHSTLRYLRVVNDSRCAPDVQCVWAGDAVVAFEWAADGNAGKAFDLHTGVAPREQAIGARSVTLVSLARGPAPEATVRIDPARAK